MNELLEGLRERVSKYSITALYPALRCLIDEAWSEDNGFADDESSDFFEEIMNVAQQFVDWGDETGIPHYVLYLGTTMTGGMLAQQGNDELAQQCVTLLDKYIHESMNLGFNLAYFDLGKALFYGNGVWEQDQEEGLSLIKKATELPVLDELGYEPEYVSSFIKEVYDECLSQYSSAQKSQEEPAEITSSVSTGNKKSLKIERKKMFTAGYYQAGVAAFIGYILVSVVLRMEFGLLSAFDMSIASNYGFGLGIVVSLLLNFAVIPLLLMAYFYKQNNGKHSIFLVGLYILYLVACYVDSFLPYVLDGKLSEGSNLLYAILFPSIFLVTHRLLSLLIYAIISRKEGESDYKIYYGIALFAPFMAWMLIIAIVFWIFQASTGEGGGSYSSSSSNQTYDMKEYVRRELSVGIRSSAVYYDNGWKVVDYWNHGSSLSEVQGDDWRQTYFKDSDGKIYILSTNCPDKETIYYFN